MKNRSNHCILKQRTNVNARLRLTPGNLFCFLLTIKPMRGLINNKTFIGFNNFLNLLRKSVRQGISLEVAANRELVANLSSTHTPDIYIHKE